MSELTEDAKKEIARLVRKQIWLIAAALVFANIAIFFTYVQNVWNSAAQAAQTRYEAAADVAKIAADSAKEQFDVAADLAKRKYDSDALSAIDSAKEKYAVEINELIEKVKDRLEELENRFSVSYFERIAEKAGKASQKVDTETQNAIAIATSAIERAEIALTTAKQASERARESLSVADKIMADTESEGEKLATIQEKLAVLQTAADQTDLDNVAAGYRQAKEFLTRIEELNESGKAWLNAQSEIALVSEQYSEIRSTVSGLKSIMSNISKIVDSDTGAINCSQLSVWSNPRSESVRLFSDENGNGSIAVFADNGSELINLRINDDGGQIGISAPTLEPIGKVVNVVSIGASIRNRNGGIWLKNNRGIPSVAVTSKDALGAGVVIVNDSSGRLVGTFPPAR